MSKRYTKELLEPVIKKSLSWAQVCREFNIKPATGSQTNIKSRAVKFQIDFSHFTGQGWNRGKTHPKKPAKDYLFLGSTEISDRIRKRLIRDGLKKEECEECGIFEWRGQKLPLELDHKNGIHNDNRLENLQILCPNCHAIKTRFERRKNKPD